MVWMKSEDLLRIPMSRPVCAVFVPQGAEFKAVQRGLNRSPQSFIALYGIPMGPQPVQVYLQQWQHTELKSLGDSPSVLLMGLCGSLVPELGIGDRVLYRSCLDAQGVDSVPQLDCNATLLKTLQERLGKTVTTVTSLMCDRMVHRATEKQALALRYGTQVVDMEGHAFLSAFQSLGVAVNMLRVVSDDAQHDLPDLSAAMTDTGTLKPMALATTMIREPQNALRLIQGSLKGLKQLEQIATEFVLKD
jgi:purine-nucleoside phosphorylase